MILASAGSVMMIGLMAVTFEINMIKLDNDEWEDREAAHKVIEKFALDEMFISRLKAEVKNEKASAEVRRRVKRILNKYYHVTPTTWKKTPWIDCIPDEKERSRAQSKYLKFTGTGPEYEGYRNATTSYIRDKMEQEGWTRARARKFLDSMVPEEIEQMKRNPSMYPEYAPKDDKKNPNVCIPLGRMVAPHLRNP